MQGSGTVQLKAIDRKDVFRYLGFTDKHRETSFDALIDSCEAELLSAVTPRFLFRIFDYRDGEAIGSGCPLPGKDIHTHLAGAARVVFLCVTLGSAADTLIRRKSVKGMTEAMVMDALASAAVENAADLAEADIVSSVPEQDHTWRFGIGYGDLPLSLQGDFLRVLDAPRRLGVTELLPSHLLTPTKSITCLFGLGSHFPENTHKSCSICSLKGGCSLRLGGGSCTRRPDPVD